MSTLAEIEAAVEALNEKEQMELLRYLNALNARVRLRNTHGTQLMDLAGTIRLRDDPLKGQQQMRDEWQ
jgi:hypothetical protein